jgi:hypothetical protein
MRGERGAGVFAGARLNQTRLLALLLLLLLAWSWVEATLSGTNTSFFFHSFQLKGLKTTSLLC